MDGAWVGYVGGYSGLHDRFVVANLGERAVPTQTFQLVMPEGTDLATNARIFARGASVHVLTDGRWLTFDLRDVVG